MNRKLTLITVFTIFTIAALVSTASAGPLTVHPSNPRYFTDGSGKAIYLTGSHTWDNLMDSSSKLNFDYEAYLDFLQQRNHNFFRMWTKEHALVQNRKNEQVENYPLPFLRTGPGNAFDGKPKFDLTKFNQAYFDRLRSRIIASRDRAIYVSVMLFQGWGMQFRPVPWGWNGHPFNINNNVNGINGDPNGDGKGLETHTLQIPAVTALQEAYVRKVIDTVNDLDNVLYEISNESGAYSTEWHYHMINYIKNYEANNKPKKHPVGMTFQFKGGNNSTLFNSPADWISPNASGGYRNDPPAADGSKVIISDTDHICGLCVSDRLNYPWAWKSFLRGLNPIYMDPYGHPRFSAEESVRRAMGHTRGYANRINLAAMVPRNDLSSTEYCLANPGFEYLVYLPSGSHWIEPWIELMPYRMESWAKSWMKSMNLLKGSVTVDLSAASGTFSVEWFNPTTAEATAAGTTSGGTNRYFTAPFSGDAVLYISGGIL